MSENELNPSSSDHDLSLTKVFQAAHQEATGSKTSAYQITTITTGIILGIIGIIIVQIISPTNLLATLLVLAILFALAFSPVRYALEELIRQLFPSTDYNSHELIKRLNIISYSTLTRTELAHQFFKDLHAGLQVGGIAFIFFEPKDMFIIRTNELMEGLKTASEQHIHQLQFITSYHSQVVSRFPDLNTKRLCLEYGIKLLTPLTVNDNLTGILVLGSKLNNKQYTTKDIKVLNAIAPKIGYAIKNSLEYEKVSRKNLLLIKELQTANDGLRQANRQLKKDDKLKDEFVYIATHELKNPVTAIKGYLSLINEGTYGKIPEKLSHPIDQINQSNNQLISLLNNLLQIARTEAEKLELKTQPVTICLIIDQVLHDLKPLLDQKNLRITHTCPNPSVLVMADPDRLKEIINNLVTNAVKYSLKGTIIISHDIIHDKLATHVTDQGVGISKEDQKKIFTRFFRVEEEAAKGIPGSGLGLFLVKQLIEKMGGQVSFKSELAKGSTFTILLPLTHSTPLKRS